VASRVLARSTRVGVCAAAIVPLAFLTPPLGAQQDAPATAPAGQASPASPAGQAGQPAQPQRGRGLLGRPSPPQPQQQQGLDYFVGTWSFTWTGRESALTSGPRTGTTTFTRAGGSNFLELRTEGRSDGGGAYRESGVLGWNDARKTLAVEETLAGNVSMLSLGDWSSPISILFDSQPVQIQGHTLRLKRTYSILSGTSFRVTEELSIDGGPFSRLGVGDFQKTSK